MFGIGAKVFTCGRWALPFRSEPMRPTQHENSAPESVKLSTVAMCIKCGREDQMRAGPKMERPDGLPPSPGSDLNVLCSGRGEVR
jgi:hypothetical protein